MFLEKRVLRSIEVAKVQFCLSTSMQAAKVQICRSMQAEKEYASSKSPDLPFGANSKGVYKQQRTIFALVCKQQTNMQVAKAQICLSKQAAKVEVCLSMQAAKQRSMQAANV